MKRKLPLIVLLFALTVACFGQPNASWDKWTWLMGEWKGEGNGQPGQGGGTFSFVYDLGKNVIVRKSHSEYAAKDNKPETIHDDLMIVYPGNGEQPKAIYFDNEGHVINYLISYADSSIILTSEIVANAPLFRLTYTLLGSNTTDIKFELSRDGKSFMTYIEGKSKKIK